MPILSNPRHERFAQELAKGKSATEAYTLAGYEGDRSAQKVSASRLLTNDNVRQRVSELQSSVAGKVEVTLASLIAEAEEARKLAMEIGQPSAAIAAVKEKGVLSGHRVEKRENTTRSLDSMSDDELLAIARGGAAAETAGGSAQLH